MVGKHREHRADLVVGGRIRRVSEHEVARPGLPWPAAQRPADLVLYQRGPGITSAAPRDSASRPTAPDPAYRSSTDVPSRLPSMASTAANRPSLARSLVGLVERPDGTARRRPPASPAMILVTGQAFSRYSARSASSSAVMAAASAGWPASEGSAPTNSSASCLASPISSSSRSSVSSFRLDRRPA